MSKKNHDLSLAHAQPAKTILSQLKTTSEKGLTPAQRAKRLKQYGPNALPVTPPPSIISLFIDQLKNPLVLLLLGTATIAALTKSWFDSTLIFSIIIFMSGVGVYLERQSEKSLDKLKSLQAATTTVLINGVPTSVSAESVVPGDILVLQDGETIAADARVITSESVLVDEASLTGESIPVKKHARVLKPDTPLADRSSMIYAGTALVEGTVTAVVVHTGTNSQIGAIAQMLNASEQAPTPLQVELDSIGSFLLIATLLSTGVILAIFLLRGQSLIESLMVTSSLAIAFVPEGLSAVLTVTLALAVSEMVAKKVIVKRLLAAEGLGSVTHIATDKTGTMTEGRMRVAQLYLQNRLFAVDDPALKSQTAYARMMSIVRFCNNNKGPTEQALVGFLEDAGFKFELEGRRVEYRFTSDTKRMSVIHEDQGQTKLLSKGAPDILIPLCKTQLEEVEDEFDEKEKAKALKVAEKLASQGFRVLAIADRVYHQPASNSGKGQSKRASSNDDSIDPEKRTTDEAELCFVGLVALMDPLRDSVKETVAGLHAAGVTPLMVTGDHPAIARYIAETAGIIDPKTAPKDAVLSGNELDEILNRSLLPENHQKLLTTRVFARVRPEHKVRLVDFYQEQGYRIAMTGDGVNDAAAIKRANVGIAMSNGVGLTKDIADVIITGSYDALLRAVAIGRTVKLRTQLYLHYLLSGNSCQVGIFFVAVMLQLPIPFTSALLLLINLFTDAAPAMAMAVEPEDPAITKGSGNATTSILSKDLLSGVVVQAIASTVLLSALFIFFLPQGEIVARTVVFTAYLFQKALRGFTARSFTRPIWELGIMSNKGMVASVALVFVAWAVMHYMVPSWLGLVQLPLQTVALLLGISLLLPLLEEVTKLVRRKIAIQTS